MNIEAAINFLPYLLEARRPLRGILGMKEGVSGIAVVLVVGVSNFRARPLYFPPSARKDHFGQQTNASLCSLPPSLSSFP